MQVLPFAASASLIIEVKTIQSNEWKKKKKNLLVTVYDIAPSDNFEKFHLGKLINPRGKRFSALRLQLKNIRFLVLM